MKNLEFKKGDVLLYRLLYVIWGSVIALLLWSLTLAFVAQGQVIYPPASQAEVNAGVNPSKFVSPATLHGLAVNTSPAGAYGVSWMTNVYLDWWSADLINTNDGSLVTGWVGRNGNILTGNCWYSATGVNGYPGTFWDGTGNNVLTNGTILGGAAGPETMTNAATIFLVFRVPVSVRQPAPASPSIILDGFLTNSAWNCYIAANLNVNNSYNEPPFMSSTYSGMAASISGQDEANFQWTDDTRIWTICWSNNLFQTFWDGDVFQNYPNGPTYGGSGVWNTPVAFMGTLCLGKLFNNIWYYNGYISEVLLFTNCLPDQTIGQINSYFRRKYNINGPSINFFGDSMGTGDATINCDFTDCLSSNFPNRRVRAQGVPGATSSQILSNVVLSAKMGAFEGGGVGINWCNLNNDGTPVTNTYQLLLGVITNNLITAAQIIRTNGGIPILVNPPSNPWADTNGERFAFQNWCTNCAIAAGYAAIIDLARDPNFGRYTDCFTMPTYYTFPGNPHLTNAAYLEANQCFVTPILNSVLYNNYSVTCTTAPPPTAGGSWTATDPHAPGILFVNSNGLWQAQ